jgi:hypothetical protein
MDVWQAAGRAMLVVAFWSLLCCSAVSAPLRAAPAPCSAAVLSANETEDAAQLVRDQLGTGQLLQGQEAEQTPASKRRRLRQELLLGAGAAELDPMTAQGEAALLMTGGLCCLAASVLCMAGQPPFDLGCLLCKYSPPLCNTGSILPAGLRCRRRGC